jgi:hypothetical protein
MSLLFYIDERNCAVLHPDAVKLCPELGVLSDKEVAFIVLAYDYNSPFKQFPERERERQAMWKVWNDNQPDLLNKHSIQIARDKYKTLQWSPKIELVKTFYKKIESLSADLEAETTASGIKKITDSIDNLTSMIQKYELEISVGVQNKGVIKGGASLSLLEEFQKQMKRYEHVLTHKPTKNEVL